MLIPAGAERRPCARCKARPRASNHAWCLPCRAKYERARRNGTLSTVESAAVETAVRTLVDRHRDEFEALYAEAVADRRAAS